MRMRLPNNNAADEGRLDARGSISVGSVIVSEGKVVRPSQLIASVLRTKGWVAEAAGRKNRA